MLCKGQERRKWLKRRASGACRTIGRHPDYDNFLAAAARAVLCGDYLAAMTIMVEAVNFEKRANMKKAHWPNLGPYSAQNPAHCEHCHKLSSQWVKGEECLPDQQRHSWIPEISDERIAELLQRIKPIVHGEDGLRYYIKPVDPRNIAYTWDPQLAGIVNSLTLIGEICTFHTYGYPGFFKPSIAEVLAQIPEDLLERVVAFEIMDHPKTADDLNKYPGALNAGYHVATTWLWGAFYVQF